MTKKKRFGISEALTRGLTETIHVVENNTGLFRNVILPLSRIELDPDNPRKLILDLMDVRSGLRSDDDQYLTKQNELEKLKELAHTIKASGVINPIVVYKSGEVYRVIAGERRCLASILAGKQEIDARVFQEKPKPFELKLLQWVENTAREDLTLEERLGNIKDILNEYQRQNAQAEISATLLKHITGLSLPQCTYYLAAINAPADVQAAIHSGTIRNLDKAAMIANISSEEVRHRAIEACMNGSSLKELRQIIAQQKQIHKVKLSSSGTQKVGKSFHLSPKVIGVLVECVLSHAPFKHYAKEFNNLNLQDIKQSSQVFRKLIAMMEGEI